MKKKQCLYNHLLGNRKQVIGRYREYYINNVNYYLTECTDGSSFFEGESIKSNLSQLGIKPTFEVRTIPCGSGCNLYLRVMFEHGEYEYSKDLYKEEMKKNSNTAVCRELQDFVVRANNCLLEKEREVFIGDDILVEMGGELRVVGVVKESCLGVVTTEGLFHLWEDVIGVAE